MTTPTSLTPEEIFSTAPELSRANADFGKRYPGESARRQPVHTVYGGAQVFRSDSALKLGGLALRSLEEFGPDPETFASTSRTATETARMPRRTATQPPRRAKSRRGCRRARCRLRSGSASSR